MIRALLLCVLAAGLTGPASGQKTDSQNLLWHITLPLEETGGKHPDTLALYQVQSLQKQGYLLAATDSVLVTSTQLDIFVSKGPRFYYLLTAGSIDSGIIERLRLQSFFNDSPIDFAQYDKLTETLLTHYGKTGYPFARVYNTGISIESPLIRAQFNVNPMDYVVFDTISISGNAEIRRFFLENHLSIYPGDAFNQEKAEKAADRLVELDFVRLNGPLQMSFSPGKASLMIPLEKVNASRFDGLVGFASDERTDNNFQITGLLNMMLVNAFGMGEYLELAWQAPGNNTQILNINGTYPYPLRLPVRTELTFSLHRQDSTWLQLSSRPAIITETSWGNVGAFMHYSKGSLISTARYRQGNISPTNLDFTTRLYGLEFQRNTPAFRQNLLRRGYALKVSAAAGNSIIHQNSNLPQAIYGDIALKSLQLNTYLHARKRWSIASQGTFAMGLKSAYMNGEKIPENQLFREGGFNSLKGFDELSLLASAYVWADAEYRFFTGNRSFFSLLVNGGWYERNSRSGYFNDWPLAAAAGINLESPAGIFALYFALGGSRNIPLEFRNGKIHVGYINTF